MKIGLQKWGVSEARSESALIGSLNERSWRPHTEATNLSKLAIVDDLRAMYMKFARQGADKKYQVTVSVKIFENMRKEYVEVVTAKDEAEARGVVLQGIIDQLETKITVQQK
ncbi:MAG: hypothetical protein ACOXZ0_07040 [Eubacteriales bacterium]